MASRLRLAGPARAAIRKVLADSERRYGAAARRRYAALIEVALRDLAEAPLRPAARRETVDGATLLTYALASSRHRVPDPPGRVQDPPHAFVYEIGADGGSRERRRSEREDGVKGLSAQRFQALVQIDSRSWGGAVTTHQIGCPTNERYFAFGSSDATGTTGAGPSVGSGDRASGAVSGRPGPVVRERPRV